MKKLFLLIVSFNLLLATELEFKGITLDEFRVYGMGEEVVFKTKKQRDEKIKKIWEKLLSSEHFIPFNSKDKKIYAIYSDYKKDSFNCFVGFISKKPIGELGFRTVNQLKYKVTTINYSKDVDMDEIWEVINKKSLSRNYKVDIERYNISDLMKPSYEIEIFLSVK